MQQRSQSLVDDAANKVLKTWKTLPTKGLGSSQSTSSGAATTVADTRQPAASSIAATATDNAQSPNPPSSLPASTAPSPSSSSSAVASTAADNQASDQAMSHSGVNRGSDSPTPEPEKDECSRELLESYHVGYVDTLDGPQEIHISASDMEQKALRIHEMVARSAILPSREDVQAELLSDEVETEEQLHEQLALIDSVIEYSGVSLSDS